MSTEEVNVREWPRPKGYANGRVGHGAAIHIGGQIGWDATGAFAEGLVAQFARALDNVIAVVGAAGGKPEDIARMTVYVTDIQAYREAQKQLAAPWRERLGKHFPAMALVGVTALVEKQALVEIEATAYVANPQLGGDP